jgi:uncharacterized membrane protein YkoI
MRKARTVVDFRTAALALAILMLPAAPQAGERERNAMREAVQRGEIRPLAEILAAIRDKLPGEVVGVEIERKRERWLYELRVVDRQGRLFEVHVDARNAVIERTREK